MRIAAFTIAVLLAAVTAGFAAEGSYTVYGVGKESCANWKFAKGDAAEGNAWVLGFWSGLNASAGALGRRQVDSTDSQGIIAEVTKTCDQSPPKALAAAVIDTFLRMSR
jgi:hypothetical protein